MKIELMQKIVDTVSSTMFTEYHSCAKVAVDFDIAVKNGLAASVSEVFKYVELSKDSRYKDDLIISFTAYDNSINLWKTVRSVLNNNILGYRYITCIGTDRKNRIEVTAELMQCIYMALNECKY